MFSLITTLIALSIFVIFLYAGTNYINFDTVYLIQDKSQISSGLVQYNSGVSNYWLINGRFPNDVLDIIPALVTEPSLPKYMVRSGFSNNVSTGFVEVCFDVTINNKDTLDMLDRISAHEGYTTFIIADSCGDSANNYPASFPSENIITYYIR